jgi:hypothetical protein
LPNNYAIISSLEEITVKPRSVHRSAINFPARSPRFNIKLGVANASALAKSLPLHLEMFFTVSAVKRLFAASVLPGGATLKRLFDLRLHFCKSPPPKFNLMRLARQVLLLYIRPLWRESSRGARAENICRLQLLIVTEAAFISFPQPRRAFLS